MEERFEGYARRVLQADSWGYPKAGEPVPGQGVPILVQGLRLWSWGPKPRWGSWGTSPLCRALSPPSQRMNNPAC